MSAILGVFPAATSASPDHRDDVGRMLARMQHRGGEQLAVCQDAGATVGVSRHHWELGAGFAGPVLVVRDAELLLAADATLYYRDDLRRKLAAKGIRPTGQTASHLILAAYRAWGVRCAEELEGDFAFVLHDSRHRRVVAARDFGGRRPLHYVVLPDGTVLFASTVDGLLAHRSCPQELDMAEIAVDAASLFFATGTATAFKAVRRLHGGHTCVVEAGRPPRLERHWVPRADAACGASDDAAADELLNLLTGAVAERLASSGPTSVWLSGGWDSPSVYAAAQRASGQAGPVHGGRIRAVSCHMSPDDVRNETGKIEAILDHWGGTTSWIDLEAIPLVRDAAAEAAEREEPWAHEYEQLIRHLVAQSASQGARVALDGFGGDSLFSTSRMVLAELLAHGQLGAFLQQWRSTHFNSRSEAFRFVMRPLLPPSVARLAAALRGGRPLAAPLQRDVPFWLARGRRGAELRERSIASAPPYHGRTPTMGEIAWQLESAHFQRVVRTHDDLARTAGLECRAPMMDGRVIRFALSRPWHERQDRGETKVLLRRAMRDQLPAEVLASRPPGPKPGSLGGYFDRAVARLVPVLERLARVSALVDSGVVNGDALRVAIRQFARSPGDFPLSTQLLATARVDLWLQARTSGASRGTGASGAAMSGHERSRSVLAAV